MKNFIIIGMTDIIISIIPALLIYAFIEIIKIKVTNKKDDKKTIIKEYIFVIYIISILRITGIIGMKFNYHWFIDSLKYYSFELRINWNDIIMILFNLLLFVPFGFFIGLTNKYRRLKYAIIYPMIFSLLIECFQLFGGRMFELNDIVSNTIGGILGYGCCIVLIEVKNSR